MAAENKSVEASLPDDLKPAGAPATVSAKQDVKGKTAIVTGAGSGESLLYLVICKREAVDRGRGSTRMFSIAPSSINRAESR